MLIEVIVIPFIISLTLSLYVLPKAIHNLKSKGQVSKDMYKVKQPKIPTNLGVVLVFTSFISIAIMPLVLRIYSQFFEIDDDLIILDKFQLSFLIVVIIYALYGLVDDNLELDRLGKLFVPIIFTFPLIPLISLDKFSMLYFGDINMDDSLVNDNITNLDLFRIFIVPVYVMVVSNLVNMHSGYNGQQSGLSAIIILTLVFKSILDQKYDILLPVSAILGSILAFIFFNFYPAKAFEGNVGSMFFGSTIGCFIVLQNYWWFGFFILIPHTLNFLLWIIWLFLMRKEPERYLEEGGNHKKFADLKPDGTIVPPNLLTLKWIPNVFFKSTEKQTVLILYLFSTCFCILGVFLFTE